MSKTFLDLIVRASYRVVSRRDDGVMSAGDALATSDDPLGVLLGAIHVMKAHDTT